MWGKLIIVAACAALTGGCAVAASVPTQPTAGTPGVTAGKTQATAGTPQASGKPSTTAGSATASGTPSATRVRTTLPTTRPAPTATWNSTAVLAPVSTPFKVHGVVLVNRVHPLSSAYVPAWSTQPNGLAPEVTAALKLMIADAEARGFGLKVRSGYRSYTTQASAYAEAQATNDAITLDQYFAKPGMSEHQTGLAADLTDAAGHRGDDFLATPEATYLNEHATDFGFIIRYPLGKTPITGYAWEPWHVRYVGKEIAAAFAAQPGLTLEEYLGQA